MTNWKTIKGHPMYQVSRGGKVKNKSTGKLLNPYDDGRGYLRVDLNGKRYRLHILVASTFLKNDDPEKKIFVDHLNGKKNDCRVSNLEWVTVAENTKRAWDMGLIPRTRKRALASVAM